MSDIVVKTPMQYLDQATNALREIGIIPPKAEEAPINGLLERISDLDQDRIAIIARTEMTRRNRFILTAGFTLGFGATMVPTWFSYVFTYSGDNRALAGFYDAIELVLETGFAVVAFVTLVLNLILPEEIEDEIPELTAEEREDVVEREEWERGQKMRKEATARASSDIAPVEKV